MSEPTVRSLIDRRHVWIQRLCFVQCVVIVIAVEAFNIESIIGSGPIFALVGISIAFLAIRQRNFFVAIFGASAPLFALFIFFLINVLSWGPADADQPVQWMSAAYAFFALPYAVWLLRRRTVAGELNLNVPAHAMSDDQRRA